MTLLLGVEDLQIFLLKIKVSLIPVPRMPLLDYFNIFSKLLVGSTIDFHADFFTKRHVCLRKNQCLRQYGSLRKKKKNEICLITIKNCLRKNEIRLGKKRCDWGAGIRATLEAMRLVGVPLEQYFPYIERNDQYNECDEEGGWNNKPDCIDYSLALKYKGITYYSLIDNDVIEDRNPGSASP